MTKGTAKQWQCPRCKCIRKHRFGVIFCEHTRWSHKYSCDMLAKDDLTPIRQKGEKDDD